MVDNLKEMDNFSIPAWYRSPFVRTTFEVVTKYKFYMVNNLDY